MPKPPQSVSMPNEITPDIVRAMQQAWRQSGMGSGGIETGFIAARSPGTPTGTVIYPHPFTREYHKLSWKPQNGMYLEMHVHPEDGDPEPSDQDKKVAERNKINLYTISQKGVYAYHPATKKTEFVGELSKFMGDQ